MYIHSQVFCFQSGAQHAQAPAAPADAGYAGAVAAAAAGSSAKGPQGDAGSTAGALHTAEGAGSGADGPAAATQQVGWHVLMSSRVDRSNVGRQRGLLADGLLYRCCYWCCV